MRAVVLSLLLLSCTVSTSAARAEVVDASQSGFTSRNSVTIAAPPGDVYARLVQGVGHWWSSDHTFSGNARGLRIEARAGGCFCEALPNGGSVRHMTVVQASPGVRLRMTGGLGPLQALAVVGTLSWELSPADGGTEVSVTYAVGGYVADGLDTWAGPVDGVIGEQLERLARYVETGGPDAGQAGSSGLGRE